LIQQLGSNNQVRFYRILADDKIISSQFSFVFNRTNYWRLPARVNGPEWDRLSLGRMGLGKMVESSIDEGLQKIEGGRGHYAYKMQMGGVEHPLGTVEVVRNSPGVAARLQLFKAAAKILDIAYYKFVFARVAPRFPAVRKPLWPYWVRVTW
jgi:CelD/BcsL family acetyltransferase involved in cellulose biosynthesis